jgi:transglutaminase-like putative cysteine protease
MIQDYLIGLIRRISGRTWMILILLWVAMGSMAFGLAEIINGLTFGYVLILAFLGVILGVRLGISGTPNWAAGVLALAVGTELVTLWVGDLFLPLIDLLIAQIGFVGQARDLLSGIPVSFAPYQHAMLDIHYHARSLIESLSTWFRLWVSGNPVFDPAAVAWIWGLAVWVVSLWSGWNSQRRTHPLVAILPAGALLAVSLSYAWAEGLTLLPFMIAALPYIAWSGYNAREDLWRYTKVDFPSDVRIESFTIALILSVGLVGVAAISPKLSINQIVEWVSRWSQPVVQEAEPFADSLGLEGSSGPSPVQGVLRGGLPRSHLIGAGPELSQQLAMEVQITAGLDGLPGGSDLPLYWRVLTYDQYTGSGWISSDTQIADHQAGEVIRPSQLPNHVTIEQEFRLTGEKAGFLYAAGVLVTADDDIRITWREPVGEEFRQDVFGYLIDTTRYRVQSQVPQVNDDILRYSEAEIPGWIQDRYLVLPEEVPARVHELALALTAEEDTHYDQAVAIESYLRTIPYTRDLPPPPLDQDIADYFIFELKQGFCGYYATAMAVMARSIGIPARVAIGYARGTYLPDEDIYRVTEDDAHAWTEVYFPGTGWVPFEPTGGRPGLERDREVPGQIGPEIQETLEPLLPSLTWVISHSWWSTPVGIALLLILLVMLWFWVDEGWLRRRNPNEAVGRLFRRLYRSAKWLGVPVSPLRTPYEFQAALIERVLTLTLDTRWAAMADLVPAEIRELIDLYARSVYSPREPTTADHLQAIALWGRLRRKLLLLRLLHSFSRTRLREASEIT